MRLLLKNKLHEQRPVAARDRHAQIETKGFAHSARQYRDGLSQPRVNGLANSLSSRVNFKADTAVGHLSNLNQRAPAWFQ
jgi:hypothetical protein